MKSVVVTAMAVLSVCAACGDESTSTSSAAPTLPATTSDTKLSQIQSDIFTPSCAKAGCHAASSASGGLSLADGESFANLVGVASTQVTSLKRVTAGSSSTSYLINKLEGTQGVAGGSGTRMPQGASALTEAQIQSIKDWIDTGAANN